MTRAAIRGSVAAFAHFFLTDGAPHLVTISLHFLSIFLEINPRRSIIFLRSQFVSEVHSSLKRARSPTKKFKPIPAMACVKSNARQQCRRRAGVASASRRLKAIDVVAFR